ncbi:unnamed protein product [Cercospora beticola]|nr:unnamed protein product [Cercospora beticola]
MVTISHSRLCLCIMITILPCMLLLYHCIFSVSWHPNFKPFVLSAQSETAANPRLPLSSFSIADIAPEVVIVPASLWTAAQIRQSRLLDVRHELSAQVAILLPVGRKSARQIRHGPPRSRFLALMENLNNSRARGKTHS